MTAPSRDRNAAADDGESRSVPPARSGGPSRSDPPGTDLLAGFQRWLIRSGTRSMRRELTGQVKRTFSGSKSATADVWDTATTEPPPETHDAPECAWCPICQAARRIRESGPGLGGQLAGVGDAVATAVQEALSAFDSVLSTRPRNDPASGRSSRPTSAPGATSTTDATAGADDEPDDRG
jgi:hypothetical protein